MPYRCLARKPAHQPRCHVAPPPGAASSAAELREAVDSGDDLAIPGPVSGSPFRSSRPILKAPPARSACSRRSSSPFLLFPCRRASGSTGSAPEDPIVGDLGRAAMLVSIPIAAAAGVLTIWQLYLVGFVNGVMTVFFDVADQSYLPTILERDELADGNAKLQISQSAATILGQPMGGGIVALLTAPMAVLIDAISYLGSAALIV
jgi:hypothetical protein